MLLSNDLPLPVRADTLPSHRQGEKAAALKQQWLRTMEQQDLLANQNASHSIAHADHSVLQKEAAVSNAGEQPRLQGNELPTDLHSSASSPVTTGKQPVQDQALAYQPSPTTPNPGLFMPAPLNDQAQTKYRSAQVQVSTPAGPSQSTIEKVAGEKKVLSPSSNGHSDDQEKKAVKPKGEAEFFKQHYISVSKMTDGYRIWARDYRINEQSETKKTIANLKELILANGGTLKNIVMNGEKLK